MARECRLQVRPSPVCYKCKNVGHIAKNCRYQGKVNYQKTPSKNTSEVLDKIAKDMKNTFKKTEGNVVV